jgi:hypothetical protein
MEFSAAASHGACLGSATDLLRDRAEGGERRLILFGVPLLRLVSRQLQAGAYASVSVL